MNRSDPKWKKKMLRIIEVVKSHKKIKSCLSGGGHSCPEVLKAEWDVMGRQDPRRARGMTEMLVSLRVAS